MRKTFYGVSGALTLFVCAFFAQSAFSQAETIVIQEVGFKEEHDFIELKVQQDGNYGGYSVHEGGVKIAELPSRSYTAGELVLLQDGGVEPVNSTAAVFINTTGGLTGTDNVVHIRDASDSPIDGFIWSNDNGNFTGNKTIANEMVSEGLWFSNDVFSSTYDNGAWIDSDSVTKGSSVHISQFSSLVDAATPGYEVVANQSPIAHAEQISGERVGDVFAFDASGSSDPEDDPLTFEWKLNGDVIGSGELLSYVFPLAGDYQITLFVSDGINDPEIANVFVSVEGDKAVQDIVISELLPNPEGKDTEGEFIELYNPNNVSVDISGFELTDGSKLYSINSVVLPAFGYHSFPYSETGIALNNDSDSVWLHAGFSGSSMNVIYDGAKEGQAYALSGNEFFWTLSPTPGAQNVITAEDEEKKEEAKIISDDSTSKKSATGGDDSPASLLQEYRFVSISEFLANPEGKDEDSEWIELHNYGSDILDLSGWHLDDESGGSASFSLVGKKIAPGYRLVLYRSETGISLNNTKDSVRLIDPWDKEVDAVRYIHAPKVDTAFARNANGAWEWTISPTPGMVNVITAPQTKKGSVSQKKTSSKKNEYTALSIAEVLKREKGDLVSLEGLVVVSPGIISKRMFIVEQNGSAIQIYKSKGDVPALEIGQKITMKGKVSVAEGETRVLLQDSSDLSISGEGKSADPIDITASGAREEDLNRLVSFDGVFEKRENNELYFTAETGVIRVYVTKGSDIAAKDFTEGKKYTISGVVRRKDGNMFVYPRFDADIETISVVDVAEDGEREGIQAHAATQAEFFGGATGLDVRILLMIGGVVLLVALAVHRFRAKRS